MINIRVPGRCEYKLENIVFDYNGTIAVNGKIISSIIEKLSILSRMADIYVLTADTYGSASMECRDLKLKVKTFPNDKAADYKGKIVEELGRDNTVCFGNGYNDIKMFKAAALSIAVLENEGMCAKLLAESDIMVKSIEDGINLLLNPSALIATLRG